METKNTELPAKLSLFEGAATGTAIAVARHSGAQGSVPPAPPPGLTHERLAALEVALKEFHESHTAVATAHGVQLAGLYSHMTAMGVSVSEAA